MLAYIAGRGLVLNSRRIILATLIFLFPVALSVWDIEEKISSKIPTLAPILSWVPYVSAGLMGLLLFIFLLELLFWLKEAFSRWQPSTLRDVNSRPAKATDIPEIVRIAQKTIGPQITEENALQLYNHNPRCLHKVMDTKEGKIIGYFCLVPWTKKGEEKVYERDLISVDMDLDTFARKVRKSCSMYIGSIAGENSRGKAAALELAKTTLAKLEVNKAFTRPVTKDGVRLVKKYGFKPVGDHDELEPNVYVVKIRESAI